MNRKSKLFFSLVSLCFSVAILCFGVYSAMQVSYSISGSISYELNDVFVDIETSLYLSTSNGLTNETTLTSKISEFETTLPTNGASETVEHSTFTDTYSSYSDETGLNVDNKPVSNNIPINYGAYQQDTTAYAYYIIVSITNLAENTINAVLDLGDTSNLNSIVDRNQGSSNIAGKETVYFIIGMALDDATISVNETFKYIITITTGELEEPILYTCPDFEDTPAWSRVDDFSLDHYMITNGNAENNDFTYEYQGTPMFFIQNFKIENLTSNYNLTMYLDYRLDDSTALTFIYPGYYSSEDIIDSFINGTQPSRPEDVPPYYDMLDALEAYEPMYLNSSDTNNGTIEFCLFSLQTHYATSPNTSLLHLCISDEPIAAELNENDGYTVRFIEDTEGSYTIPSTYYGKEINAIDLRVGSYGTLVIPNTISNISIESFTRKGYMSVDTLILEDGIEYSELSLYVYITYLEIRDVNFANNIQSSDITLDTDQSLPTFKVKCNSLDEITNEWLKSSAFTQPTETVDGYAIFIPA